MLIFYLKILNLLLWTKAPVVYLRVQGPILVGDVLGIMLDWTGPRGQYKGTILQFEQARFLRYIDCEEIKRHFNPSRYFLFCSVPDTYSWLWVCSFCWLLVGPRFARCRDTNPCLRGWPEASLRPRLWRYSLEKARSPGLVAWWYIGMIVYWHGGITIVRFDATTYLLSVGCSRSEL